MSIESYLSKGGNASDALRQEELRHAISSHATFFCSVSGKPLDVRKSALIRVHTDQGAQIGYLVCDGSVLDERKATLQAMQDEGLAVTVIDGRKL